MNNTPDDNTPNGEGTDTPVPAQPEISEPVLREPTEQLHETDLPETDVHQARPEIPTAAPKKNPRNIGKRLLITAGVLSALGLGALSIDQFTPKQVYVQPTATDSTYTLDSLFAPALPDTTQYQPITQTRTFVDTIKVLPDTAADWNSQWDIAKWAVEKEGNAKPSNRDIANKVYEIQTANPQIKDRKPDWSYDAKGKKQSKGDGMIDMIYMADTLKVPVTRTIVDTIGYEQRIPMGDSVQVIHYDLAKMPVDTSYIAADSVKTDSTNTDSVKTDSTKADTTDSAVSKVAYLFQQFKGKVNDDTAYILAASDYAKNTKMSETDILTLAAMAKYV
ncbi:hypothetical protein C4573_06735 [Candidatus Woesearchaeota archaeon]|nr:MAG: hypothetical protein C4573_06735 [Candidatus Woesearchaeota archaeon]